MSATRSCDDEQAGRGFEVEGRGPGSIRQQVVELVRGVDRGIIGSLAFGIRDFRGQQAAIVALALEAREDLRPFQAGRPGDLEGDDGRATGVCRRRLGPDRPRIVVLDLFPGLRVEAFGDVAEPDFEEIGQFRHRAHGGTGGFHRVGLLDGDGGADVLDRIDPGLGEQLQKLARVGAEGLDVAPLALGVQGLEHERRSCPRRSGR